MAAPRRLWTGPPGAAVRDRLLAEPGERAGGALDRPHAAGARPGRPGLDVAEPRSAGRPRRSSAGTISGEQSGARPRTGRSGSRGPRPGRPLTRRSGRHGAGPVHGDRERGRVRGIPAAACRPIPFLDPCRAAGSSRAVETPTAIAGTRWTSRKRRSSSLYREVLDAAFSPR